MKIDGNLNVKSVSATTIYSGASSLEQAVRGVSIDSVQASPMFPQYTSQTFSETLTFINNTTTEIAHQYTGNEGFISLNSIENQPTNGISAIILIIKGDETNDIEHSLPMPYSGDGVTLLDFDKSKINIYAALYFPSFSASTAAGNVFSTINYKDLESGPLDPPAYQSSSISGSSSIFTLTVDRGSVVSGVTGLALSSDLTIDSVIDGSSGTTFTFQMNRAATSADTSIDFTAVANNAVIGYDGQKMTAISSESVTFNAQTFPISPVYQSSSISEDSDVFTLNVSGASSASGVTGLALSSDLTIDSVVDGSVGTTFTFQMNRAATSADTSIDFTAVANNAIIGVNGEKMTAVSSESVTFNAAPVTADTGNKIAEVDFENSTLENSVTSTALSSSNITFDTSDAGDHAGVFTDSGGAYVDLDITLPESYVKHVIVNTTDLSSSNFISSNGSGVDHAFWCSSADDLGMGHAGDLSELRNTLNPLAGQSGVKMSVTSMYDHDTTTGYIYLNGNYVISGSVTTGAATGAGIRLGQYQSVGSTRLNGNMYLAQVYEGIMTPSEIAALPQV